ncbi:MAG: flagellar hook-associated protein FlgL [Tepidanaerobacteraceae bacterium]
MRVTQGMITEAFMRNLSYNLKRLGEKQEILSSGKRVRLPSDDPVSAALAIRLRGNLEVIDQHKRNAEDAFTWMKNSETALSNTNDIIQRIRELVVKAANGTNTPDDRNTILDEISQLKEQVLKEANANYNQRYLFGGFHTDKAPFYKDGDGIIKLIREQMIPFGVNIIEKGAGITDSLQVSLQNLGQDVVTGRYLIEVSNFDDTTDPSTPTADITIKDADTGEVVAQKTGIVTNAGGQTIDGIAGVGWNFELNLGDSPITGDGTAVIMLTSGNIEYNVGNMERIGISVSARDLFSGIFETIGLIEQDILNDNAENLSNLRLAEIDDDLSEVLRFRSQIGAKMNRLEATVSRLEFNKIDYTELLSKTEDADIAEVIMGLKMEESVYRASLAVGSRVIQPSLADFLW